MQSLGIALRFLGFLMHLEAKDKDCKQKTTNINLKFRFILFKIIILKSVSIKKTYMALNKPKTLSQLKNKNKNSKL